MYCNRAWCVFNYHGKEKLSIFHVFNNRHWSYFRKSFFLFSSPTLALTVLLKLLNFIKCFGHHSSVTV